YSGMIAVYQLSVVILARRRGSASLLVTGTSLVGIAWLLAGMAGGLKTLLLALLMGGLGASVQHPLASSLINDSNNAGGVVK
ncbi:MFS transporter, partial [Salmonella enterica subsp. enterica serovar Infantis]